MAIDYDTKVGQVRLLISDVDESNQFFSDAQIQGFLTITKDGIRRAAAYGLDTIANSEVLISKVLRTQDGLTTDGAKVADALRKGAEALRKQAEEEEDDEFFFDLVPYNPHGWRAELTESGDEFYG